MWCIEQHREELWHWLANSSPVQEAIITELTAYKHFNMSLWTGEQKWPRVGAELILILIIHVMATAKETIKQWVELRFPDTSHGHRVDESLFSLELNQSSIKIIVTQVACCDSHSIESINKIGSAWKQMSRPRLNKVTDLVLILWGCLPCRMLSSSFSGTCSFSVVACGASVD